MRTDAGIYRFGPFELDPERRRLAREGTWLRVPVRQMNVLLLLIARAGQVVSKDTLIAEAWDGVAVAENNIVQAVKGLRTLLGTQPDGTPYIHTAVKHGYRFAALVERQPSPHANGSALTSGDISAALEPYRAFVEGRTALETLDRDAVARAREAFASPGLCATMAAEVPMIKDQVARCDMLARVRKFGETHREQFPDASIGGQAFAAVAASLAQLNEDTVNKISTTRDRQQAQQMARAALRDRVDAIARTARVIARTRPGFDDPFRMPQQRTDSVLLTTGRVFVQSAEPLATQFIAHGMPQTFIADVKNRIDQLERAVHDRQVGKSEQVATQTAISAALSTGTAAVRTLNLVEKARRRTTFTSALIAITADGS